MPCSDSSSSIALRVDPHDRFISFDFAKITCGREISGETGYNRYCVGRSLTDIITIPYMRVIEELKVVEDESRFILYLEWDALRSAIAQYLGLDDTTIDRERCHITSVENNGRETEVAMVILPPAELPKILPCSLAESKVDSQQSKEKS